MRGQKIVNKQLQVIEDAVNKLVDELPITERHIFDRVMLLLRDLDVNAGNVVNNSKNVVLIGRIKNELKQIVVSNDYLKKTAEFVSAYNEVDKVNAEYFALIADNYQPPAVLSEIKKLNIETTISDLTDAGVGANFTDGIRDVLTTNITTGASYTDMVTSLRDYIIGSDKLGENGRLVKYARQIATDSINQYNGQYIKAVTDDLGLEWYMYVGSNLKTTRPFCKALSEKLYFHVSEIPDILNGHIGNKTVSLAGLYPDTNEQNFFNYRGGYNCGHQIYPVMSGIVPKEVRDRIG